MDTAGGGGELNAGRIERPRGADVDGGADAAGGHVGLATLVNLHRGDAFRGQIAEVEGAAGAGAGRQLAAVQQHQIEFGAEAAHGDPGAFATLAVDRHTGDALQGFGQVTIWEVANVLGGDGIHHAVAGALEFHGALQALANADHDDLLDRPRLAIRGTCGLRLRVGRRRTHRHPLQREGHRQSERRLLEELVTHCGFSSLVHCRRTAAPGDAPAPRQPRRSAK